MGRKTAWEERATLEEKAVADAGRARDAALRLEAGRAKAKDAHDRLVAAHRDGNDSREIERAKQAIRKTGEDLQFLKAEAQGLAQRAAAKQQIANFDVTDNSRLLDELRPGATEVRDRLAAAFAALPEIAAEYDRYVTKASALVSAAGKSPREEGPDGHGLDQLLQAIRQQLNTREIPVPLPHGRHSAWVEQQNQAAAKAQARESATARAA
ncbi:MAG: hypothetical protein JW895_00840 [Thermoleophilaceae bacterium]|nr:hypothetical protein [Thermoleophilaceae bacterium]